MNYPFADKPDDDLARQARDGDEAARERLLDSYIDVLFTFVVRLTGDSERGAEALRDGFAGWFRALRRSAAPQGVRGSMYRMALAAARAAGRGLRPNPAHSPRAAEEQAAELKATGARVEGADRAAQLQWVLAAVPARSREVLVMADIMGMSDEQTAFILGIKPSAVAGARTLASRELLETYTRYGPVHKPGSGPEESKLRAELRAIGWDTAPWHFKAAVRQALRDRRDPVDRRLWKMLLIGLVLLLTLLFLWRIL